MGHRSSSASLTLFATNPDIVRMMERNWKTDQLLRSWHCLTRIQKQLGQKGTVLGERLAFAIVMLFNANPKIVKVLEIRRQISLCELNIV